MRIYEQIIEGQIVLRRCQGGCGLWYPEAELCTNEETLKLQCDECYMVWQAEQEDMECEDDTVDHYGGPFFGGEDYPDPDHFDDLGCEEI